MAGNEKANIAENIRRHFITSIEHTSCVYCAQRQRNRINNLAVFKIDKFCTATTKVENDAVLNIQGVDYTKITDVCFCITGNDMQLDAGFFHNSGN